MVKRTLYLSLCLSRSLPLHGTPRFNYNIQMAPYLEVSHLPSASSFYSAIIQPLGLHYHTTEDGNYPAISFGISPRAPPYFKIIQVFPTRERPLKRGRIVLGCPSATAIDQTYERAVQVTADAWAAYERHLPEGYTAPGAPSVRRYPTRVGAVCLEIFDFDGNMSQIVYVPPPDYPPDYDGSTLRRTKVTDEQATRILDWSYEIADTERKADLERDMDSDSTESPRTRSRRSYSVRHPEDERDDGRLSRKRSLKRRSSIYDPATSAREDEEELEGSYRMSKSSRRRSSRHEYDYDEDAPAYSPRSPYADYHDDDREERVIEVERSIEKVRHPGDYAALANFRRPLPEVMARYSQVGSSRSPRDDDDLYDEYRRGRHSSSRSRHSRTRSEAAAQREPYPPELEHRSYVSLRSSRYPPPVQRTYTYDLPPERDGNYFGRSHRSVSTLRAEATMPPPPPPLPTDPYFLSSRSSHHRSYSSREGSYTSASRGIAPPPPAGYYPPPPPPPPPPATRDYYPPPPPPPPPAAAGYYPAPRDYPPLGSAAVPGYPMPGRHAPLPLSGHRRSKSRTRGRYESSEDEMNDDDSIVPDDSISCVGR